MIAACKVLIEGQALGDAYELVSVNVEREVNRIPTANLVIGACGDSAEAQEELLGGGSLSPGAKVEIKVRPSSADVTIFKGIVAGLGARSPAGIPRLDVVLKDAAIALVGPRRSRVFSQKTDADAISDIVKGAGLSMGDAPTTKPEHAALVQHNATDWDFILSRADAQGLMVLIADGTLSMHPIALTGSPTRAFSIALGDVLDMQFALDFASQRGGFSGEAWDSSKVGAGAPAQVSPTRIAQGGKDLRSSSDALSLGDERLIHMVPMRPGEVEEWAAGRFARSRFALVRGRISVSGKADLQPLEIAALKGFGDRFDGEALITGVRHRLDRRGFATEIQFGLAPEPFGRTSDIADAPARGLLPPISGLQLGLVSGSDPDPDNEARVQIAIPAIAANPPQQLWARIATPDAGKDRGVCFFPEVEDEVVVGFLDDDPRHPVILGRLHGGKNTPPAGFTDGKQKGIVTAKGVKITLTEADNPSVTIETKAGRTLKLDDDGKTVTIADAGGNTITFSSSGVSIKSASDLTIEASGSVKIKGASIDLN